MKNENNVEWLTEQNIALEQKNIELTDEITGLKNQVETLKEEVLNSLRVAAGTDEKINKLHATFLGFLTQGQKTALKENLIKEFGLKE